MNICIYTVYLFVYECITCKVKSCLSNYCTFHISYVTNKIKNNYKIASMKKNIIGGHPVALVGQAKDFHQHHIWCFPLPCTGGKSPWNTALSPAMISCDVLTCSIHASNTDIWSCALWSTYIYIYIYIYICSQTWLVKWLNQIVLQLEVICQFSRHYKQCQCQIFMEYTCVYTDFW